MTKDSRTRTQKLVAAVKRGQERRRELTAEEKALVEAMQQRALSEEVKQDFDDIENLLASAIARAVGEYAMRKGDTDMARQAFIEMARRHAVRPEWFIEQLEKAKGMR